MLRPTDSLGNQAHMPSLHIAFQSTSALEDLLRRWDEAIVAEGPPALHRWTNLAVWPSARSATVAGSTGIEGNPLTAEQVDDVLAGGSIVANRDDVRDVRNYNAALDIANRAALRTDFEWSQELLRRLNAEILAGLEDDERGEYRREPVTVSGIYAPPDPLAVPSLMGALVEWLRDEDQGHTLVRAGLAHLNVVSIHPWLNGNGRASRVVGSLVLMRRGIAAPELVNIESVIRANREDYVDVLQETHGPTYQPDRHSATAWLEYFARISVDRLNLRARLTAAIQQDIGLLTMELDRADDPLPWAPVLLASTIAPVRTAGLVAPLGLSMPRIRAMLAGAAASQWLRAEGQNRGRRYLPGPRLDSLPLRTPDVMDRLRRGAPIDVE
jgi:Fic family protein